MMIACHHYFWGNVFGFSTRNEREREKLLTLYFLQKIRWFLLQNRPKFSCNLPLRRAAVLSRIKNASDFFCQITFDRWKRKTHSKNAFVRLRFQIFTLPVPCVEMDDGSFLKKKWFQKFENRKIVNTKLKIGTKPIRIKFVFFSSQK